MKMAYPLLLGVLLVVAVAGGVLLLVNRSPGGAVEILLPTATPTPELKVYMTGAVVNPGVYTLQPSARLEDALEAAGGPTGDADLQRVNLAQQVRDEDAFHIPRVGEPLPTSTPQGQDGRVNLNTASQAELEQLPDIGPVKAQAIIEYRETNGPFRRVEDLLLVPGIGPATLQQLRELVTVGD
ncbi:MAG: helix-hairpin-helix domain-containing protein [Dehalococcoidia bacterium]